MINRILLILALLLGLLPAQAQFQSVTTTANGTLHSPTNLWAANSLAIGTALAANPDAKIVRLVRGTAEIGAGYWLIEGQATVVVASGVVGAFSATITNVGPQYVELTNGEQTTQFFLQPGETAAFNFSGGHSGTASITYQSTLAPLPTTNGLLARTGDGTTTARAITGTAGQIDVTNGNGTSGNPTLSLPTTITGNRTLQDNLTVQGNTTLGDASGDSVTINAATITASNANGTASNSISNVGTLTSEMIFRPWVRHIITEINNFETAMLSAVGGTSGNSSLTGGIDRPAWVYRPASTTDGAENWQTLIGPFKSNSIGTRNIKNWSKRTAMTVYAIIPSGSANTGTTRYLLGPNAGTYAGGPLAVRGIGFIITNKVIFAVAHNGTTLTTAGSGVTLADNTTYVAHIESDGAGGVRWWINGVEQTAITGGPTGNSAASEYGFVTSALNATPATSQFVAIQALRIISEL